MTAKIIGRKLLSSIVALTFALSVLLPSGTGLTARAADSTSGSWGSSDNYDTGWYDAHSGDTNFTITSAAQLAGLAQLVNHGDAATRNAPFNFTGKTVTLGADIDLSGHYWVPIGYYDDSESWQAV